MAYTTAEEVKIYRYLGRSPTLRNNETRFSSAITSTLSTADGGAWPDNTVELSVRALLASIDAIEARRAQLWEIVEAGEVDEVKVDAARAGQALHAERRRLIIDLCNILALDPRETLQRVYGGP